MTGSRLIVAAAINQVNKEDTPNVFWYSQNVTPILPKSSYFYGFFDEISNYFAQSRVDERRFPAIINLLPYGNKKTITQGSIEFRDQRIVFILPIPDFYSSDDIDAISHEKVLNPLAERFIDSLVTVGAIVEPEYEIEYTSSKLMSEEEREILTGFGDYYACLIISNLNFSINKLVCDELINRYEEIFNNLNNVKLWQHLK